MRCTGAILAGGPASRFGGAAKGLIVVGGRRIIDRVAEALTAAADELIVVSNAADAAAWLPSARVVHDELSGRASLIGLHAALRASGDGALVVAWDMPFASGPLLRAMRELGERSGRAVVPESPRGPEPLCAYYPARAAVVAEHQVATGELRLESFVQALGAVVLPESAVAAFGDPALIFSNVNDPTEAERADRSARGATG